MTHNPAAYRPPQVPGGTSRFGALSTVLFDMGKLWRMYTPPYIILLSAHARASNRHWAAKG